MDGTGHQRAAEGFSPSVRACPNGGAKTGGILELPPNSNREFSLVQRCHEVRCTAPSNISCGERLSRFSNLLDKFCSPHLAETLIDDINQHRLIGRRQTLDYVQDFLKPRFGCRFMHQHISPHVSYYDSGYSTHNSRTDSRRPCFSPVPVREHNAPYVSA